MYKRQDIRNINPYAAYDLKYDEWTVTPDPNMVPPSNPSWDTVASNDRSMAAQLSARYTQAMQDMQVSQNEASRRNAQVRLLTAGQQASALYDEIHTNRSLAFSPSGEGYGDFHNYRWQAGKRGGTIVMLKNIRKSMAAQIPQAEMPDTSTLIRRAVLGQGR